MDKDTINKAKQDRMVIAGTDSPVATRPTLSIDWELYGRYLEESDLSDDQKREFLETLWSIVVSFVDLGFGLHPIQQACEQPFDLSQLESADVLRSIDPLPQKVFSKAAEPPKEARTERSES